tara:strand:- start:1997 stop:2512 length:516 start_codon:yes stop_codon:yes gene_type:complete
MEKRINNKVNQHLTTFKEQIKKKLYELNIDNDDKIKFLEYLYSYPHLKIDKEDFLKRKRVKNVVPHCFRCKAKRATGEQCSRRKKGDTDFCGTHIKGTPHGKIDSDSNENENKKKSITIWAEEIMGITYYIDEYKNVYSPEEILKNVENPKVIAKWEKQGDKYTIPALFNR